MNEVEKTCFGDVDVYYTAICPTGECRRDRERSSVRALVDTAFGSDATIGHREDGSPYISGQDRPISISHSQTGAVLAVGRAGSTVGIDLENYRSQLARVAPRILSAQELAYYTGEDGLLAAWTLKEAAYKCAGIAGLDFRRDIVLPCGGQTIKISPADKDLTVIACGSFMGQWISLVVV